MTMQIDGISVSPETGDTILSAARRANIPIPTLCYDPRVKAAGACRLCLVEVENTPKPVPACTHPASDGLKVKTNTERVRRLRRQILELVLSENPEGKCTQCDTGIPCDLHRLTEEYDAKFGRFRGRRSGFHIKDANPLIARNYESCITCTRCVRVCNELEQAHAITVGGAGFASHITTAFGRQLQETECSFCGQCVQTCPTGALEDRTRDRSMAIERSVRTICAYCGVGCGVLVDVAGGRIVGTRGDPDSPVSEGSLCVKGRFGWHFVHNEDRLTTPLIRRNGQLEPATWDEALELISNKLLATREAHGPDSIVFWSSSRATNEANYLFQKFARAGVGTNNVDNCART